LLPLTVFLTTFRSNQEFSKSHDTTKASVCNAMQR